MKRKMRLRIALLSAIILLVTVAPEMPVAYSENREKPETLISGSFVYSLLDDGTTKIERYTGEEEKIMIPEELDGNTVTAIGSYVLYRLEQKPCVITDDGMTAMPTPDPPPYITAVILPDSITTIGRSAFSMCIYLETINIPNSVTSIGDYAFHACRNLTVTVGNDSCAMQYCIENNIDYLIRQTESDTPSSE